ncbi:MAG: 2-amino-4-hydroxy-6-hydroxymethyldihydropteridine diphosphokinase [Planctomycetes bacterium]|nr:2-amino-4-hydroxy-6-hydroxymethyldihydropteridine diphosphokinase [Planctomycetota bacterium]
MTGSSAATVAYLGLGSNLGDRLYALHSALRALERRAGLRIDEADAVAAVYETSPVGGPSKQPSYLNTVVRVCTELAPWDLLRAALEIEAALGRVRGPRDGPRGIDIDILLYGAQVLDDAYVTLPHPRLHERRFVLEPLCDLAPCLVHPVLHVTVEQLTQRARDRFAEQHLERYRPRGWQAQAP